MYNDHAWYDALSQTYLSGLLTTHDDLVHATIHDDVSVAIFLLMSSRSTITCFRNTYFSLSGTHLFYEFQIIGELNPVTFSFPIHDDVSVVIFLLMPFRSTITCFRSTCFSLSGTHFFYGFQIIGELKPDTCSFAIHDDISVVIFLLMPSRSNCGTTAYV